MGQGFIYFLLGWSCDSAETRGILTDHFSKHRVRKMIAPFSKLILYTYKYFNKGKGHKTFAKCLGKQSFK